MCTPLVHSKHFVAFYCIFGGYDSKYTIDIKMTFLAFFSCVGVWGSSNVRLVNLLCTKV